jgi:hypothetical protein
MLFFFFSNLIQVDLSGRSCNKVGVSFEAFRTQPSGCVTPVNTCLANQLDELYLEDLRKRDRGLKGDYLVSNW